MAKSFLAFVPVESLEQNGENLFSALRNVMAS